MKRLLIFLVSMYFLSTNPLFAGDVKIVKVQPLKKGDSWHFNVTLKHDDTGWDHYADAWRIVTEDGVVLGERTLYHPHTDEQPFTRGLSDVKIPETIKRVYVEAHDKVHGWAKERYTVDLK